MTKKVTSIIFLSSTSSNCHHHKVTNVRLSLTSLWPNHQKISENQLLLKLSFSHDAGSWVINGESRNSSPNKLIISAISGLNRLLLEIKQFCKNDKIGNCENILPKDFNFRWMEFLMSAEISLPPIPLMNKTPFIYLTFLCDRPYA